MPRDSIAWRICSLLSMMSESLSAIDNSAAPAIGVKPIAGHKYSVTNIAFLKRLSILFSPFVAIRLRPRDYAATSEPPKMAARELVNHS